MVDINVMGCDLAAKNLKDNPLFITEIKGGSYFQNMRKDVAHELIDTRILRVSYFDVMYYLDKVLNSIPEQKLDVLFQIIRQKWIYISTKIVSSVDFDFQPLA